MTFNSISWADDLIVVSTSREGLQSCLDRVERYCYRWSLRVNTVKTKCMVMEKVKSRARANFMPLYKGECLEVVDHIMYLGWKVSYNMNWKHTISDRLAKSRRAMAVVRQALSTTGNVSVPLSVSLFKKQIVPILTYGCPLWSLPKETNYVRVISSTDLPKGTDLRRYMGDTLRRMCGRDVMLKTCKRLSAKAGDDHVALLDFGDYSVKEYVITQAIKPDNLVFEDWDIDVEKIQYEKIQSEFSKYVLNVNKYASSKACRAELGLFPLCNTTWSHAIKYYLRMEFGTGNALLNAAFSCAKVNNHTWFQSIQRLLRIYGFGYVLANPLSVNKEQFHHEFHRRVDDIYVQYFHAVARRSSRLQLLGELKENYDISPYVCQLKSIEDRKVFTRLRIDLNVTKESQRRRCSKAEKATYSTICDACKKEPEDVRHLLLTCENNNDIREKFSTVKRNVKDILDLKTTCNNNLQETCRYVKEIYQRRCDS
jgi:hypothetical protein